MYPLTCVGGFNVPARAGKFEIVGFTIDINDPTLASHVAIIDDEGISSDWECGRILDEVIEPPTEVKGILVHKSASTLASNIGGYLEWFPPESVKTVHGISIHVENVKQGSFCLYVR
jgi:hypothetical protein